MTKPAMRQMTYKLMMRGRRVLVPIGRPCPFGCRYCYAGDARITAIQHTDPGVVMAALRALPADAFDVIQLGYDGDPLASRDVLRAMLPVLAETGKHINISTKAKISADLRRFLGDMHTQTPLGLSLNVSATCWESAPDIEPRTPSAYHRLKSASLLQRHEGVPFVVSLRPILPSVPMAELCRVLDHSREMGAVAVVTGPLYVQPDGSNMSWADETFDHVEPTDVSWSPVPLRYRRVEDTARVATLKAHAKDIGLHFYPKNEPLLSHLIEMARI